MDCLLISHNVISVIPYWTYEGLCSVLLIGVRLSVHILTDFNQKGSAKRKCSNVFSPCFLSVIIKVTANVGEVVNPQLGEAV